MSIAVLCPVYMRDQRARECLGFFEATATNPTTDFFFAADADDPTEYPGNVVRAPKGPRGMTHPSNYVALQLIERYEHIMWVGCDHAFRTKAWDEIFHAKVADLGGYGFVYGDDLEHGESLPTSCMVSSKIIRALGYLVHPTIKHLYADDFWLVLGKETNKIVYSPEVVVEHMHPSTGKADNDDSYEFVNSKKMKRAGKRAFKSYLRNHLATDVKRILAIDDPVVRAELAAAVNKPKSLLDGLRLRRSDNR